MPFHDRTDAGRQLADKLQAYAGRPDVVVLALPRGGIPVAYEVAAALRAPLDVLVVRRLTAVWNHELTIGAAAGGGPAVVDEDLCRALSLPPEVVRDIVKKEQTEVERRDRLYRGACGEALPLRGRTVILVDDGMATGASMRAAVSAVAERRPAAVVVAVPVASYATCAAIAGNVREIVYLFIRDPVYSVGLWYEAYPPISDTEACELLKRAHASGAHPAGSGEHYRELGADGTAVRERRFEEQGGPVEIDDGSMREAEPRTVSVQPTHRASRSG
jgi:predicted phosphoribosyltransferase